MYKLLIITKNLVNTQNLINTVIGEVQNIKISGIVSSLEKIENIKKFDFILFHECEYDYPLVLEQVSGIICIGDFKLPVKRYEKRISISCTTSAKFIKKQIDAFTRKLTLNTIRQKAMEILLDLGFNFKHIGTKYLADAIYFCYSHENFDSCFENLERETFPYIAKINNTHVENVKWSLTRTINLMYFNHTTKSVTRIENYFYLNRFEKPTPKTVIGTITNNLLAQYKDV